MNHSTPDVRNLTQKELAAAVKAHENADGTASQFTLPGSDIHVTINACYVGGSGQHRAWKYLYYLTINGRKCGGYDRRDSFVAWAIGQIKEVAPQQGVAGVSGVHPEGQLPTPSASVPVSAFKPDAIAHGLMLSADTNTAPSADSQALEVASSESSTAQTDTTGMAATASVDVPEEISLTDGVIVDENLALALDEGQNSSNAWRLHEHVQHGLDRLTRTVEGVLIRGKVIEPELAEVGQ